MKLTGPMALLVLGAISAAACRDKAPATSPAPAPAIAEPPPPVVPAAAAPVAATDGDAYFAVIEPHFARVSIYAGPDQFLDEYGKTPEKPRHLLAAHWGVAEISNGGLHQLFSSSVGMAVPEVVAGLRALGLPDNAVILEEAAAQVFGKTFPRDHQRRRRALETYEKAAQRKDKTANPFADDDERFFAALKRQPGGFDAVAAAYARSPAPR